jgi:hypothetical protein
MTSFNKIKQPDSFNEFKSIHKGNVCSFCTTNKIDLRKVVDLRSKKNKNFENSWKILRLTMESKAGEGWLDG